MPIFIILSLFDARLFLRYCNDGFILGNLATYYTITSNQYLSSHVTLHNLAGMFSKKHFLTVQYLVNKHIKWLSNEFALKRLCNLGSQSTKSWQSTLFNKILNKRSVCEWTTQGDNLNIVWHFDVVEVVWM